MSQHINRQPSAPPLGRVIVAGLVGIVIAVGCLLIPIVHFVSGPLGPLIGGVFAGIQTKAGEREALIIGPTIGVGLTVGVSVIGATLGAFIMTEMTPDMVVVSILVLAYGTLLGILGALLGGRIERGKGRSAPPAGRPGDQGGAA